MEGTKAEKEALFRSSLWSGISAFEQANVLGQLPPSESFIKGEVLFSADHNRKALLFILRGSARITRPDADGNPVFLRELKAGDVSGVASLFREDEDYISEIRATSAGTALFCPAALWRTLMRQNFLLAENYMIFLTDRIRYLNHRIAGYTDGSVEERLLGYLKAHSLPDGRADIPSLAQVARTLNISRSSLYRALDELLSQNKMVRSDKEFYLTATS